MGKDLGADVNSNTSGTPARNKIVPGKSSSPQGLIDDGDTIRTVHVSGGDGVLEFSCPIHGRLGVSLSPDNRCAYPNGVLKGVNDSGGK